MVDLTITESQLEMLTQALEYTHAKGELEVPGALTAADADLEYGDLLNELIERAPESAG